MIVGEVPIKFDIQKGFHIHVLRTDIDEFLVTGIKGGRLIRGFYGTGEYLLERYRSIASELKETFKI